MKMRHAVPLLPAAFALMLSACATSPASRYPSLAIRDVERIKGSADTVQPDPGPPPPVAPSADLAVRLAQLGDQAQQSHQKFLGAVARTQALVLAAAGSEIAGENWSAAQAALASLDAARNPAVIALADLDRLYVDSELQVGAVEAIAARRDAVQSLVNTEEETMDRLAAQLPGQSGS